MFSMTPGWTSEQRAEAGDDAGQQQHRQVRLVLAHARVALRDDLVLGRGQPHHAVAVDGAVAVDVAARQDERRTRSAARTGGVAGGAGRAGLAAMASSVSDYPLEGFGDDARPLP